jgi:hypothetical protein
MISTEALKFIQTRLPAEMKRYIFKYIDINTRIKMIQDSNPFLEIGTERNITDIENPFERELDWRDAAYVYTEGWVKQLFMLHNGNWYANNEFRKLCPNTKILTAVSNKNQQNIHLILNKNPCYKYYNHNIITIMDHFRLSIKMDNYGFHNVYITNNRKVPIAALALLLQTDGGDIDINYFLRKKAFKFMIGMVKYLQAKKEKREKAKAEREARIAAKKAEREAKRAAKLEEKRAARAAVKEEKAAARAAARAAVREEKAAARAIVREEKVAAKVQAKEERRAAAATCAALRKETAKIEKLHAMITAKQAKEAAKVNKIKHKKRILNVIN